MENIGGEYPSVHPAGEGNQDAISIFHRFDIQTAHRTAVVFADDHILGYVYQTASEVARVSRSQSGIDETFARTVGGNNILSYRQTLFKVGFNR